MEKNSSKKGDIKISLLGLLIGISLIVAGVYGIVSNKIENQEYKNSTDIRTVNAVVEECRRKDEKNDADILIRSEYNTKVSFVVDGTTYKGRTYFVFGQNELKNSLPFQDKIRRGDEVSVEVYRTSKGSYKIKPDNDIITFLLCCMAIPVGAVVVIIMVLDIFKHASVKRTQPINSQKRGARMKLVEKISRKFSKHEKQYDSNYEEPVIRCSICTGEQVAGFLNLSTGKFEEVMLIRTSQDLENFQNEYGITGTIKKIY